MVASGLEVFNRITQRGMWTSYLYSIEEDERKKKKEYIKKKMGMWTSYLYSSLHIQLAYEKMSQIHNQTAKLKGHSFGIKLHPSKCVSPFICATFKLLISTNL